jgi:hypothetical protein
MDGLDHMCIMFCNKTFQVPCGAGVFGNVVGEPRAVPTWYHSRRLPSPWTVGSVPASLSSVIARDVNGLGRVNTRPRPYPWGLSISAHDYVHR